MNETIPASSVEPRSTIRKRNLIIVFSLLPVSAFFALLAWGVIQSGGNPGGFGINSKFGEIPVEQRLAHQFEAQDLDGRTVRLSELQGKVVMLDFWSSWCPPCRREAPTLAQVYGEYKDKDVEFIGVAIWDNRNDVADHVAEYGLSYPNLLDRKGRIAIDYGVAGIPEKIFIDSQGNLVRKYIGPTEPEALRTILNELLGL